MVTCSRTPVSITRSALISRSAPHWRSRSRSLQPDPGSPRRSTRTSTTSVQNTMC